MRVLLLCLALGACATAPSIPPPERVEGCWGNRASVRQAMRWTPDAARPGAMLGTKLDYVSADEPGRTLYSLEPSGRGHALCELDAEGAAATRCWQVAQGQSGSLEGGRAFIDRFGARLRISVLGAGPERIIFQGHEESCD